MREQTELESGHLRGDEGVRRAKCSPSANEKALKGL